MSQFLDSPVKVPFCGLVFEIVLSAACIIRSLISSAWSSMDLFMLVDAHSSVSFDLYAS